MRLGAPLQRRAREQKADDLQPIASVVSRSSINSP